MWIGNLDADVRCSVKDVLYVREVLDHRGIEFKVLGSSGRRGCKLIQVKAVFALWKKFLWVYEREELHCEVDVNGRYNMDWVWVRNFRSRNCC